MSVFDDILGTLFGGADTSAQDFQRAANVEARQAIDTSTAQARGDVLNLFPQADVNRNLGFQAALDVLGQSIPQQLQAFQAGNVGAQEALIGGLPQFRSAILGGQFDPTAFQPTQVAFDPAFTQQAIPEFATGAAPRTGEMQQAQATQALSQLLSGGGGGFGGGGDDSGAAFQSIGQGTPGTGNFLEDLQAFISNVPNVAGEVLDSPLGFAVPGGVLAKLVNEIFGGAGSESAGQIGTSSEPGISDAAKGNRLRAERARAAAARAQRAATQPASVDGGDGRSIGGRGSPVTGGGGGGRRAPGGRGPGSFGRN